VLGVKSFKVNKLPSSYTVIYFPSAEHPHPFLLTINELYELDKNHVLFMLLKIIRTK